MAHDDWDRPDIESAMADDNRDQPDIENDRGRADIELVAGVTADKLVFHNSPDVKVRFPGEGRRDSRQVTRRRNVDTPVVPGKLYRRVVVRTEITSRLIDGPDSPIEFQGKKDARLGKSNFNHARCYAQGLHEKTKQGRAWCRKHGPASKTR